MELDHKAQEERKTRLLKVRVEPTTFDRFRAVVEADNLTVSQALRRLVRERIADAEPNRMASVVDELGRAA